MIYLIASSLIFAVFCVLMWHEAGSDPTEPARVWPTLVACALIIGLFVAACSEDKGDVVRTDHGDAYRNTETGTWQRWTRDVEATETYNGSTKSWTRDAPKLPPADNISYGGN